MGETPTKAEAAVAKPAGRAQALRARVVAEIDKRLSGMSQKLSLAAAVLVCATPLLLVHARAPQQTGKFDVIEAPAASPPIEIVKTRPMPAGTPTPPPQQQETQSRNVRSAPAPVEPKSAAPTATEAKPSPAPQSTPQAAPQSSDQQPAKAPPPPDTWSEAEVTAARNQCTELLKSLGATVQDMPPIKQDRCGTPAPVSLRRLGPAAGNVELTPPAVLNCNMVAKLSVFVEKTLQPAAIEAFGARVVRFNQASGFVCRGRNGDTMASGKVSEHALANALDVASFTLADGRIIDVGKHWGPAARDFKNPAPAPAPVAATASAKPLPPGSGRSSLGVPPPPPAKTTQTPPDPAATKTAEALFLRRLHQGACTLFGTVLGPEANEAHREHFHFDLHPRRHSNYCQ